MFIFSTYTVQISLSVNTTDNQLSKLPPSSSPFIPHQEPEEGCENVAAIWQKVLRQQALTLSFLTRWEAEPCCIGINQFPPHVLYSTCVILTTRLLLFFANISPTNTLPFFLLVLHFSFYLENTTNSYLQSRILLFCNTVDSQNLAKI